MLQFVSVVSKAVGSNKSWTGAHTVRCSTSQRKACSCSLSLHLWLDGTHARKEEEEEEEEQEEEEEEGGGGGGGAAKK